MKKIINGKMYNTETAKKIASYIFFEDEIDGVIIAEYLYKKTNGEYFLCDLDYSDSCRKFPENFIPYSIEKAKKWLEENASADIYIQEFGEVEE